MLSLDSKTTFDLAGYRPKLKLARQHEVTLLLRIMPTFENLILAAPAGFSQGCSNLNSFSASEASSFEQIITGALTTSSHLNVESVERNHVSHFKIVSFIVRAYRSANPTPTFQQMAVALDQNTLLTRECVEALIITIKNNQANEQLEPVSLLTQVGTTVSICSSVGLNAVLETAVWEAPQSEVASWDRNEFKHLQKSIHTLRTAELRCQRDRRKYHQPLLRIVL
jgi:hypothetical protein